MSRARRSPHSAPLALTSESEEPSYFYAHILWSERAASLLSYFVRAKSPADAEQQVAQAYPSANLVVVELIDYQPIGRAVLRNNVVLLREVRR